MKCTVKLLKRWNIAREYIIHGRILKSSKEQIDPGVRPANLTKSRDKLMRWFKGHARYIPLLA